MSDTDPSVTTSWTDWQDQPRSVKTTREPGESIQDFRARHIQAVTDLMNQYPPWTQ